MITTQKFYVSPRCTHIYHPKYIPVYAVPIHSYVSVSPLLRAERSTLWLYQTVSYSKYTSSQRSVYSDSGYDQAVLSSERRAGQGSTFPIRRTDQDYIISMAETEGKSPWSAMSEQCCSVSVLYRYHICTKYPLRICCMEAYVLVRSCTISVYSLPAYA